MDAQRVILHLDMDAFFAAVEQRDRPELRGKPLLIGYDGPRGVVATASYEARAFGCHSAQPMSIAKRRCPQAIVVPGRGKVYREVSRAVFAVMNEFSPLIEPLSIDEAFIDMTGTQRAIGDPVEAAQRLKQRVKETVGLTASVGVAPNKFLAKLASDMDKPNGLTVIREDDVDAVLLPMPVTRLWGVGKATAGKLESMGIRTIRELRNWSVERLKSALGSDAQRYYNLARGIDHRPVVPDREAKSISHEHTFTVDVLERDEVRRVLFEQVEQVATRLRRHGLAAKGVAIKVRFGDFQTVNRSATLDAATDITSELWEAGKALFDRWSFQPVRLIGFGAERLENAGEPMELFPNPDRDRQRQLDSLTDTINEKFGSRTIKRGGV